MYTGNKNKVEGMLDFDLFFGLMNFYGDLKASDIKKKEAMREANRTLSNFRR